MLRYLSHLRSAGAGRDYGRRSRAHYTGDGVCQAAAARYRWQSLRLYARCADDGREGEEGDRVCTAVPAVHRAGNGEGCGGHGVFFYDRLTGMNEVGSDPGRNGLSVAEFHAYCEKMQTTHPATMTTLATHDTKRSDDVRARLAVLSEIPGKFYSAIQRWSRMNSAFRTGKRGSPAMPDRD